MIDLHKWDRPIHQVVRLSLALIAENGRLASHEPLTDDSLDPTTQAAVRQHHPHQPWLEQPINLPLSMIEGTKYQYKIVGVRDVQA